MVVPFTNKRMRVFLSSLAFVIAAVLMIFTPKSAWAQTTNAGTIVGEVTDNTNAIVPSATVTITLKSTGAARTATTNNEGHYVFADVDPGTYDISVTKQGFASTVVTNQVVQVGTQLTANVKLQVGSVSTTVTVTETAGAELQTLNSTVGSTILNTELMNLPNVGRDATTFATLQPATGINGNTAGAVSDQNTFQLDGGTITDDMSGDNNTYIPGFTSNTAGVGVYHSPGYAQSPSGVIPTPVTSIEEFKVGVSNQTADFNQGAGSQVQMVTKRGTNTFHGTAYEYYLDNNFGGANTWDDNAAGFRQPTSHYSRFGAAAGGKIPKVNFLGGGWYLFGNYEGYRFPDSESFTRDYPTASLRAGLIKLNGEVVNLNPIATIDPEPQSGENASIPANTAICAQAAGCVNGSVHIAQNATDPCPSGKCDPLGLGMNPTIQAFWSKYLPMPNNYNEGDQSGITTDNYAGYTGNLALPQTSNFGVLRLDHDFNSKWHFNATYHFYRLDRATSNQVDVGGFFSGDTLGDYESTANRPQIPWYYTAGLTTNITSNLTNDFHYSMTRNYWAYESNGGIPDEAGYPAAFEIGGETSDAFEPYNTDNQDTRTRFWDGHDNTFRDDLTLIKGNHLFQFGGLYEHSWEEHQRIDNGGAINIYEQYLIGVSETNLASSNISGMPGYTPTAIEGTGYDAEYSELYSMDLGMVDQSQVLYTRSNGSTLTLNPFQSCAIPGNAATADCQKSPPALNQSIIPTYNLYFGDSWHIRPTLTINYGLGYTIEMPPYSPNDAQDVAVDSAGNPLITSQYFGALKGAALQGQTYQPEIGFETINNLPGGPKYPYDPYYDGFSPRISAAWNFSPNTVIRGGYARVFGRLNGVDQVLVPILAPGLMQTDQCLGPNNSGGCGGDASTIVRVGDPSGVFNGFDAPLPPPPASLPQPWYPGYNSVATGSAEALDPSFKPNRSDEFNLDIQRQLTPKIQIEAGYIGRIIRNEYQSYDLNAVPYMMTEGGQTFANAWGNLMLETNEGANLSAAQPQPFLEAALGGPTSAYCSGFSSCTAAWLNNPTNGVGGDLSYAGVHDAWAATSSAGAWTFGRSLPSDPISSTCTPTSTPPVTIGCSGQMTNLYENASNGYGNYNAGFLGLSFYDWHGLTAKSNLTYSKAMGTGAVVQATSEYTVTDPFNLGNMYGLQSYDETWTYNMYFNWALPFYRNQAGMVGRFLGGWSISPLFVAGSGFPDEVNTTTDCESYGESPCVSDESTYENAIATGPINYSNSRKEGIYGVNGIGVSQTGQNALNNPAATFAQFRNPILGVDGDIGGAGNLRGLPFWNCDVALNKKFAFTEKFSGTFQWQITNVFNHMQAADPYFSLGDPSAFGVLGGNFEDVQQNVPREMEFGFHVDW